jgi:hypothetical protein
VPALSAVLGGAVLLAFSLGGKVSLGLQSMAIMLGFGVLVLVGGRSETVRGLRGDGRDERFRQMDIEATALAGLVLIVALIVCWLVSVARGQSGQPYDWLAAVGGLAYLAGIAVFRWRR